MRSNTRIVRRERAVAKDRIVEEVDGGHGHDKAVLLTRALEVRHDAVAFLGSALRVFGDEFARHAAGRACSMAARASA